MEPHNVLTSLFLRGRENFLEQVQKASSQNQEPCVCTYTSRTILTILVPETKSPPPSPLSQMLQVRQARLIIGAHGGAMANMILAPSDAGRTTSPR